MTIQKVPQSSPDQVRSPSPDAPSPLVGSQAPAELGPTATAPSRGPSAPFLTDEQVYRIHRIYSMYVHGWDQAKVHREIGYVGQNLPLCESCRLASATLNDYGFRVCMECKNGGAQPETAWTIAKDMVRGL